MRAVRVFFGLAALGAVTACTAIPVKESSPEEVAAAVYRHNGPTEIVLYTMINNRTGAGAHTSMMINAPSQRVIFDPAGSVQLSVMPEIGDVLYGITPQVLDWYERAHARNTYHVRIQRLRVPPEVATQALRLVQAEGAVASAACTSTTSRILSQLPGFGSIKPVLFPTKLADQFAQLPGVQDRKLFENDADDKGLAEAAFEAQLNQ